VPGIAQSRYERRARQRIADAVDADEQNTRY